LTIRFTTRPSPWRDLPDVFGDWNSVFRRFSRWSHKGVWWRIFAAMSDDPDFEYLIVDSTIIRAHQHASGAKKRGSEDQALGRSRGGLSACFRNSRTPIPLIRGQRFQ
jgi:hypothetical protein